MAGRLERMAPSIPAPGTGPSARRATCTGTAADHRGGGTALAHRHTTQSRASVSGAAASPTATKITPICTRRCPASRTAADEQNQGGSGAPAPRLPVTFRDEPRRLRATTHAAPDAAGIALSRPKSAIGVPEVDTIHCAAGSAVVWVSVRGGRPYRVLSCGISRTTSAGSLSSRRPWNRGWRSSPSVVHSLKPTSATRRGSAQCTPDRGSRPRSNGGRSRSRAASVACRLSRVCRLKPVPTLPA